MEDWIKRNRFYILLAGLAIVYIALSNRYDGSFANLQVATIEHNEGSFEVWENSMHGAHIDEDNILKCDLFYEANERHNAITQFNYVISQIGRVHLKESIEPRFLNRNERYFVCRGEEWSIIVSYNRIGRTSFGAPLHVVSLEYAKTDDYDWGYLTRRVNGK